MYWDEEQTSLVGDNGIRKAPRHTTTQPIESNDSSHASRHRHNRHRNNNKSRRRRQRQKKLETQSNSVPNNSSTPLPRKSSDTRNRRKNSQYDLMGESNVSPNTRRKHSRRNSVVSSRDNKDNYKSSEVEMNRNRLKRRRHRRWFSLCDGGTSVSGAGPGGDMRLIEKCSWPQCNKSCPKLLNPVTGEEVDFKDLLKSFGLDMSTMAKALGIDLATLNNMDHQVLLQMLTQHA